MARTRRIRRYARQSRSADRLSMACRTVIMWAEEKRLWKSPAVHKACREPPGSRHVRRRPVHLHRPLPEGPMASRTFDVEDSPGPPSGNDRYLRRSWCAGMRGAGQGGGRALEASRGTRCASTRPIGSPMSKRPPCR